MSRRGVIIVVVAALAALALAIWGGKQLATAGVEQESKAMRAQLVSTETELSRMQSEYSGLQEKHTTLQSQLTSLTSDYNNLMMRYSALEKTKVFVIDDRLKVAVFTEAQLATAAWVRGEVTNTGTTTMQRVYVLLFRYKTDGSLEKLELPPTVLLNLAPQATGYFSFLSAGENYKIMMVGDY